MKKLKQVRLSQHHANGTVASLTCWLDDCRQLQRNRTITLKDGPAGWWKVEEVYATVPAESIKRDWHVGGL